MFFFTKFGDQNLFENRFYEDSPSFPLQKKCSTQDCLTFVFGSETLGLYSLIGEDKMKDRAKCYIPMDDTEIRSYNLANCVAMVLFEAHRQRWEKERIEKGLKSGNY